MIEQQKIENLNDKRSESVTLRLTKEERERLADDADLAGLSISEIIRRRFFFRPIVAKVDIAAIRELRRQGGLLKHLQSQGGCGRNQEAIQSTLAEIRKAIEKMARHDNQEN